MNIAIVWTLTRTPNWDYVYDQNGKKLRVGNFWLEFCTKTRHQLFNPEFRLFNSTCLSFLEALAVLVKRVRETGRAEQHSYTARDSM